MWPVFASLIVINLPVVDIRILWFRKRFGCVGAPLRSVLSRGKAK